MVTGGPERTTPQTRSGVERTIVVAAGIRTHTPSIQLNLARALAKLGRHYGVGFESASGIQIRALCFSTSPTLFASIELYLYGNC